MSAIRVGRGVAACLLPLLLASCVGSDPKQPVGARPTSTGLPPGEPSLVGALEELQGAFDDGPALSIGFIDLTEDLVVAARDGSVDLIASDEGASIDALHDDGLVSEPIAFATTRLAIAVAPGNPKRIGGLDDLSRADITVVLCDPTTLVGRDAREALDSLGGDLAPASVEPDAIAAMSRVARGEVDAALVYLTDVAVAADVDAVGISSLDTEVRYVLALVKASGAREEAEAFQDFVLSEEGRSVLARLSFQGSESTHDEGHEDE